PGGDDLDRMYRRARRKGQQLKSERGNIRGDKPCQSDTAAPQGPVVIVSWRKPSAGPSPCADQGTVGRAPIAPPRGPTPPPQPRQTPGIRIPPCWCPRFLRPPDRVLRAHRLRTLSP